MNSRELCANEPADLLFEVLVPALQASGASEGHRGRCLSDSLGLDASCESDTDCATASDIACDVAIGVCIRA